MRRSPLGNNSFLNFTRGSLIELSNGTLRRVEELRTEDFIMSAEKSPDLQLADSTVVKIMASNNSNCVMITFSYDNSRSKVRRNFKVNLDPKLNSILFRLTSKQSWNTPFLYTAKDGRLVTLKVQ